MSQKPETTFITSVEKFLPKDLYRVKMNNPFNSGIADKWYSGHAADLWVEYKFLPKLPKKGFVDFGLTTLQSMWLTDRENEGRRVAVVVGNPLGGLVLSNGSWETKWLTHEVEKYSIPRIDIARWILGVVE
jgi:hypothetical protein